MILVTGATGHVGNVLARRLVTQGRTVRALVMPGEDCRSLEDLKGIIQHQEGNVLDLTSLEQAMQDVSTVYHLAGLISIVPGAEARMERVNVEGTRNVAQVALRAGVRRMIHTSSIHAFRRVPHGVTLDESVPFDPNNAAGAYDRTKARGTLAVLEMARQGLDVVVVCPTGIIGPYDFGESEMGRTMVGFAQPGLHFLIEGAFDFVDVRDVVQGLILAGQQGRRGETYILAGTHVRLAHLHTLVQSWAGIRSPLVTLPLSLARWAAGIAEAFYRLTRSKPRFTRYAIETLQDNSLCSHAKAQRELGYVPRSLRVTVADTLAWWGIKRDRPG